MIKSYSERRLMKISLFAAIGCLVVYMIPFIVLSLLPETKDYKKYYMPVEFPDFFVLISHDEEQHLSK